jgi:hypothetical protein
VIPESAYASRSPVSTSSDLERILKLARRPPLDLNSPRAEALVELMTARLRRPDRPPGTACGCAELGRLCIDRLLPSQAWALWEAPLAGGLLAPVGVGAGKTLLDVLMPMVMPECKVAVLFVPPGLVGQLVDEYDAIAEHFVVPSLILPLGRDGRFQAGRPATHVLPYSRLSRPEATDYLKRLAPDLMLADECHRLKNRLAVGTGRVLRDLAGRPETRLCGWSGTITSNSILNFTHLAAFMLGEGSPVPLEPSEAEAWASALDPSDWPAPAGALKALATPGESVLAAVGRRIRETRGVVSTVGAKDDIGASLVLRERDPGPLPGALRIIATEVRKTWVRPDGEELVDALSVSACIAQLNCGFYYRWRFPGRPDPLDVDAWFAARKAWGREMRERLKRPQEHLDSPRLLANAAQRFETGYAGDLPVWQSETWARWRNIKDTVKHETEAVWVDDYLVRDAAAWVRGTTGIVWYEHAAFGASVAALSGAPLHGGGPKAGERLKAERGDRGIVASIGSHGEGRDGLQFLFSEQLITYPMNSGKEWEQLLGRLHRRGQKADEVTTHVYRHVPEMKESIDRALRLTRFVEGLTTASQRLLAANVEWALGAR